MLTKLKRPRDELLLDYNPGKSNWLRLSTIGYSQIAAAVTSCSKLNQHKRRKVEKQEPAKGPVKYIY